jgi:GxxExxY protein
MNGDSELTSDYTSQGMEEQIDLLKKHIRESAKEVMDAIGAGLPKEGYVNAFTHELTLRDIDYASGVRTRVFYKGVKVYEEEIQLVVENLVMVEIKANKGETTVTDAVARMKRMILRTDYEHYMVINFEPASEKSNGNIKIFTNRR